MGLPKPAEIAAACRAHEPKPASNSDGGKLWPWEQRVADARAAAAAYAKRFEHSTIFAQAKAEGWDWPLIRFVEDMAFAQARAVHGSTHCPDELYRLAPDDAAYELARQDVFTARLNGGDIDVALPVWLLKKCQANATTHTPTQEEG